MMIGDIFDYVKFVFLVKNQKEFDVLLLQFIFGVKKEGVDDGDDFDDDIQICSCYNVIKVDVVNIVKDGICKFIGEVKFCIKVGIGCGGCMFFVIFIFNKIMKDMGNEVKNIICFYFNYSCVDFYNIIMVKWLIIFQEVMKEVGVDLESIGCEVCKFMLVSIFVSLWNKYVMDKFYYGLQEINDRYLGNIQWNGIYLVVF